jgi:hypothetical protein
MKFQKMIRVQLMLLGLGAALLIARPVCAQQDTDPTLFESSGEVTSQDPEALNVAQPSAAVIRVTAYAYPTPAAQELDQAPMSALDIRTLLALMVGIGAIVLLGMAEAVRGSRRRTWKERKADDFSAGAAAY